jgi:FAD/FMN-containing dehydrogenase
MPVMETIKPATAPRRPADAGFDQGRAAWNLNAHHRPVIVVKAEETDDVMATVRFARNAGMGIGVMATGHGTATPVIDGVLVNTSRLRRARVNPATRTARVEAGARWTKVGSAPHVGIVGYTMGGGFGWLGRKFGFNADSIVEVEVVTAEGELVTANAHENADLFWGLKGGGGNFGIVTSLEFALHPVVTVYAGNLFYAAYSSTDWERLMRLKSRYDPHNLFRFNRNIPPSR